MSGRILIVSGPSGSGKSTLLSRLMCEFTDVYFSISSTTREIRSGEKDGVNYHYISENEFKKGIDDGLFLEWARVHNNYYGTSLSPVKSALHEGKDIIFDIDVQGHDLAMKIYPELITSVFVTTKNKAELKSRLQKRGTDSDEVIENRLINAMSEMKQIAKYDYCIINDDLERSYDTLRSIFVSMRANSQNIDLDIFLRQWNI